MTITRPNVLLVDDYPPLAEIWSKYLENHTGCAVSFATSLREAREASARVKPDLLIVDLDLDPSRWSECSGWGLISESSVPWKILMHSFLPREIKSQASGTCGLLDKYGPDALQNLCQMVQDMLSGQAPEGAPFYLSDVFVGCRTSDKLSTGLIFSFLFFSYLSG